MYHSYFGLDEQAFSIAVNPRYLYMSKQHREALAHLLYGVSSGGFVMLSGEVGTGKTTIIRCLLEQLPANADLAIIMNPSASARDLLCTICDEFGVEYAAGETSLKVLTDKLSEFLVANHQRERKSIVLIDEAQLLRISTLEQVRLLTNLETNTQKLLQIILVGQPELNELLAKPALRQLSQRITARYHLRPLSEEETEAYIKHRLSIAGMPAGQQPFPSSIVRKVHRISRGIPRLVNILCDRMLLGAYSRETNQIDAQICRQAAVEVLGEVPSESFRRYQSLFYAGAGTVIVLMLALTLWLVLGDGSGTAPAQQEPVVAQGSIIRETGTQVSGGAAARADEAYWLRSQDRALAELLEAVGIPYDGALYPCWVMSKQGYACETGRAPTWDALQALDRPAVLQISTPARYSAYVTLVGISGGEALLLAQGALRRVSLEELGAMWTGEYVFVWRRPEPFTEAVGLGSRGAMVEWVAQQFAKLDGQQAPLAQDRFNRQLRQRVKIFQREHNLQDDGFVGLQTLLKLNQALGLEQTLTAVQTALMGAEG